MQPPAVEARIPCQQRYAGACGEACRKCRGVPLLAEETDGAATLRPREVCHHDHATTRAQVADYPSQSADASRHHAPAGALDPYIPGDDESQL